MVQNRRIKKCRRVAKEGGDPRRGEPPTHLRSYTMFVRWEAGVHILHELAYKAETSELALQPGIDRLAFQRQDAEHALVHPP